MRKKGAQKNRPWEKKGRSQKKKKKGVQGLIIFMKKIIAVNQRKISKMADFDTKKCKKQPFREKRAGQKKKRAQQGHTEKIALEQKKGAKKKKKSRGMPFFFDRKKGRP